MGDLRQMSRWLAIAIGVMAASIAAINWLSSVSLKKSTIPPEVLEASTGIDVYQLETNRYINFPLLAQTDLVRIGTNAEFSDTMDLRESSNKEPYSIEVQAYDISGNLIETRVVNVFSNTQFYFAEDWGMYLPSFYLDSDAIPSQTRINTLNYRDVSKVAAVKIRRLDNNPHLKTIYVRVYQPTRVSKSQLNFYWYNLLPVDKERLAGANLYPVLMIKPQERQNLINNLWSYVGAGGIPDVDYFQKKLYSVTKPHGIPYDINLLHSGNYIDESHQLIVPIEENNSSWKIEIISADIIYPRYMKIWLGDTDNTIKTILKSMQPQDSNKVADIQFTKGQSVELLWRGRGIGQTINLKENIPDRHLIKEYQFNAGLLTISSNAPAYVNISKKTAMGEDTVTLAPASISLLRLNPSLPIDFSVFHSEGSNISFRVDLRRISTKIFDASLGEEISYELLDNNDRIIKQGTIVLKQVPTKLDFAVRRGNMYVSEKDSYYFSFSPDVAKIRFKAPDDIYISVFNRLDNWQRHYHIPQDYKTDESKIESLRRTWFYKIPINYDQVQLDQRTLLIKVQPRALPENEEVKESIYDWQGLLPEGTNWTAVEIATRKNAAIPSRSEAEAAEFSPISTNLEHNINITGFLGEKFVAPALMYSGQKGTKISITLDNKEVYASTLQSQEGIVQLPNVAVGPHNISIKTDKPLTVSINYNKNDNNSYMKRSAVSINKQPLNFIFEKKDEAEKTITLRVYAVNQKPRTVAVTVNGQGVLKNQPLPSYTIRKRDYQITFDADTEGQKFIGSSKERLFASEPMFIKIGSELPQGTYKIEVATDDGECFVALSSLTSGLVDKRSISTEVQDE